MKKYNIIGIGEVLWDIPPQGKLLGGAPANFAYHLCQMGANGLIISAVGDDLLGHEIIHNLNGLGVNHHLFILDKATGTVTVELNGGIPSYTIHENVAWDNIELTLASQKDINQANAICFGSLAQRNEISRKAIWQALEMVPKESLKVFDVNLRQSYYSKGIIEKSLSYADVCKLNDEELVVLAEMFALSGNEEEKCQQLINIYNLDVLALTKGIDGSILMSKSDTSFMQTPLVKVADTIGAGDSFTATMVMGLLYKLPFKHIHELAVEVSAFVCTQHGATPLLPDILKNKIKKVLKV